MEGTTASCACHWLLSRRVRSDQPSATVIRPSGSLRHQFGPPQPNTMEAHQMRRMRSLLLSIGLGAALASLVLAPVSASYPGLHNGRIAFGIRGADGSNIFSVLPDGSGQKQLTKGPGFHFC